MVEYILGNYLVSAGRITQEQFESILDVQDKVRVKLGLIAVAEGLLTMEQADEVNRLQSVMDKRFGDIAIEKGYLTDAQVGNLLKMQGNAYLVFVQTLVNEGYIAMDEMDSIIADFKKVTGFGNSEIEALKSGDIDKIIPLYLPPEATEYQEIIGVAVRTIIRCIDRSVYLEKACTAPKAELACAVIQTMEGTPTIKTGFADKGGGLITVANGFAGEEFDKIDEDVMDAVGEFINCINGLYASAMSQKGVTVELLPPEFNMNSTEICGDKVCIVPINIKNSKVFFVISE